MKFLSVFTSDSIPSAFSFNSLSYILIYAYTDTYIAKKDGKYGVINNKGVKLIPFELKDLYLYYIQ